MKDKDIIGINFELLLITNLICFVIAFLVGAFLFVQCDRDLKELTISDCVYIKDIDNVDYCLIKVGK